MVSLELDLEIEEATERSMAIDAPQMGELEIETAQEMSGTITIRILMEVE